MRITLPATLPDADDTVIVAEVQCEVQPIVTAIRQASDGSFKLLARDADLAGGVQVEGDPPNLGYWISDEGAASWTLEIDRPGNFTVTLDYALDPGSPGSECRAALGDQSLTSTLAVT